MTPPLGGGGAWLDRLRASRHALWLLGAMSFLETIIVPVPIEVVLVPFMMANRQRVWTLATVTTAGCLAAALLGYGVGYFLYESVGTWFIDGLGFAERFDWFRGFFDRHGFLAVIVVGILPIPFQIAMITAGLASYPIMLFVAAACIARGIRYFGLAWLVVRFGDRARETWRRHALVAALGAAALVLAIVLLGRYLAGTIT